MKKALKMMIAVMAVVSLFCTTAFAQDNGGQGGQQSGGMQQDAGGAQGGMPGDQNSQNGGQTQGNPMGGMSLDTDTIAEQIAALDDTDTAATLTALLEAYKTAAAGTDSDATMTTMQALQEALTQAGIQLQGISMGGSQMNGTQYGRYLDTDKMAAAIAGMTDTDAAANLTTLLQTYQTVVSGQDDTAVVQALQALFSAMNQTQVQPQEQIQSQERTQTEMQTQSQPQDNSGMQEMEMGGMNTDTYSYLDTDAVAAAITMTDSATATTLSGLLQAYTAALISDDQQTVQSAFSALMDALSEAGL